jgi:hypothetical protein
MVIEAPTACGCCGSSRIVKLGEDVTQTLGGVSRDDRLHSAVDGRSGLRRPGLRTIPAI